MGGTRTSGAIESDAEHAPSERVPFAARLAAAPASAEIRGVFFELVEAALRNETRTTQTLPRPARRRAYAMYPLRDYLALLQEVAQELGTTTGPSVERGLAELHRNAASFLLSHPGARLFLSARDRDPSVLLDRLERSRSLIASYGEWRVHGTRGHLTISIRDEFVWIEEVWAAIVRSVFTFSGIERASVTVQLEGPFDGVMEVRW